jgi:23S rRNA-/tRNA-specific pseudouridylate synthase
MVNLSYQFRDRKIKKTYTAIVNGMPPPGDPISAEEAHRLGVDVDPDVNGKDEWQIIDHALEDKSAVTVWKVIKSSNSTHARDNILTSIELKPKTGRFHQLRRHLSWVLDCPIVGDNKYDGGGDAIQLREKGLFLCSNKVTLEHPSYNDMEEEGITIFQQLSEKDKEGLWMSPEGKVMVTASIEIPDKFESFISDENNRYITEHTSKDV